jgi:hypothetical protein
MTGVGSVGAWAVGGAAAPVCRSASGLVRNSKPQDSQNWPERADPQVGHGSLSGSGWAGGTGGRVGPDDGADSGQGAGAGIDSRIRIPHVSQKSVLSDS